MICHLYFAKKRDHLIPVVLSLNIHIICCDKRIKYENEECSFAFRFSFSGYAKKTVSRWKLPVIAAFDCDITQFPLR